MSLIRASIRRPVAVSMLFVAIAALGVISLRRLPIDLLPDLAFPRIVIYSTYPNVSPLEVEKVITARLETQLARVPGKETIESVTREGVSLITIRFRWGTNMNYAMVNVREQIDNARSGLPQSATVNVLRSDPTADPIMTLSVTGPSDLRQLKEVSEAVFKRRLEQLEGVAQAEVTGGLEREIHVDVDPDRMRIFGVTLNQIADALDASNYSAAGGSVRRGLYRYSLRTLGEFVNINELGEVSVQKRANNLPSSMPQPSGTNMPVGQTVMLRDIATITDSYRERESIARYNGREAVGLLVFKESGANTVEVSATVREALDQLREEYDEFQFAVASDQAGFISAALANVQQQVLWGGLLAFMVLFLFLKDIRYPIAIALAIPVSVLAAFILLDLTNVSLNIMSLGGLALGVGMLVDNSIVVTENIFRHREMGKSAFESAAEGVREVRNPVIASTLTTIAVFGPIIYLEGVAGALFGALSFAVAFSLAVSIIAALLLLPTMAARWTEDHDPRFASWGRRAFARVWGGVTAAVSATLRPMLNAFDRQFEKFRAVYERMLDGALRHRFPVVMLAAVLLAVTVYVATNLRRSVLPEVDQGSFTVVLTLPRGTPIERTSETARQLEDILLADSGSVSAVFSRVGRQILISGLSEEETGTNSASLEVRLHDGIETGPVVQRLRQLSGPLPDGGSLAVQTGQATALGRLLGGSEADLSVRVSSQNMERAVAYATALEAQMESLPALTNVAIGNRMGQPEVVVDIDNERAAERGIQPRTIASSVTSYMRGVYTSSQFIDFDRKIPILVRMPDYVRDSLHYLDELVVSGTSLRELIATREGIGASEIRRVDQKSLVTVFADITNNDLGAALDDIKEAMVQLPPPTGVDVTVAGENEEMQKSLRALAFAMMLALLLVYMIMAAEFESFVHPFTVLLSVPLGTFGAIMALAITGAGLNTISLIGIVVLAGVVDNDAVVKVDFINQMRAQGMNVRDAIRAAGHHRLRPILITTVTTLLGVLPMALGVGAGAKLQQPLAIAIFGGLTTSTLLTLIVIPVVYDVMEQLRQSVRGAFGMTRDVQAPAKPADGQ